MKKKTKAILTLIVVVLTTSCTKVSKPNMLKDNFSYNEWRVIEIDSCEYIYEAYMHQGFLAHKGNCKYCEKRRKEERE